MAAKRQRLKLAKRMLKVDFESRTNLNLPDEDCISIEKEVKLMPDEGKHR